MKQQLLRKMVRAFRVGSLVGAILSFLVYVFARVLFYEFSFTAKEEVINFFTIIITGGVLVSLALVVFLLLETVLNYFMILKISHPVMNFRSNRGRLEAIDYPMAELNRTA
ncbi:MAG: hypothetical protein ABIN89_20120 [Chitinophagaceae bacterium]